MKTAVQIYHLVIQKVLLILTVMVSLILWIYVQLKQKFLMVLMTKTVVQMMLPL